jgi:hypothetical protein
MRVSFARAAAAAAMAFTIWSVAAPAEAESVMAGCATQWKQAQAAGTTGGATWPQYLQQCKTQGAAPAAAPAPAPAQSGSLFPWNTPPAAQPMKPAAGQSVMAACGAQWQQAKAAGTTGGATWPQFLKQCRAGMSGGSSAASVAPAPAPAPAPAQSSGSLFPWLKPTPAQTATPASPTGAGQFSTEAEARYRCPTDKVVWINLESKVYHYQGAHYYGHTKKGAYMCEADATASGARASRAPAERKQTM